MVDRWGTSRKKTYGEKILQVVGWNYQFFFCTNYLYMQFTLVSYEVRVILIAQTLSDTVLTLNAIHSEEASYFMPCQILLYKTSFLTVMHESDSGMGMESGMVPFFAGIFFF